MPNRRLVTSVAMRAGCARVPIFPRCSALCLRPLAQAVTMVDNAMAREGDHGPGGTVHRRVYVKGTTCRQYTVRARTRSGASARVRTARFLLCQFRIAQHPPASHQFNRRCRGNLMDSLAASFARNYFAACRRTPHNERPSAGAKFYIPGSGMTRKRISPAVPSRNSGGPHPAMVCGRHHTVNNLSRIRPGSVGGYGMQLKQGLPDLYGSVLGFLRPRPERVARYDNLLQTRSGCRPQVRIPVCNSPVRGSDEEYSRSSMPRRRAQPWSKHGG